MPSTIRPLFENIDSWLQEVDNVKTAAAPAKPASKTKKAGTKKAAPAGMGETAHPSEDIENNTQDSETGSRYSENAEDVKRDVPGQSVDSTDENSGGSQDDKQYNIGTNQSATGEDSAVEDDYKPDKDDPGTEHPMNADDTGEKYSSWNIDKLLKTAEAKANGLLASLSVEVVPTSTPASAPQTVVAKAAAAKAAVKAETPTPTEQPVVWNFDVGMDKIAAEFVEQAIRDAELDADLVGSFLHSYHQTRNKRAADEEGEDHSEQAAEEGSSEEGGGEEAALPPVDPAMLGAAGGGPPPAAGGDVLGALGAGGPPPEAAAPPADAGGGMNQEQALQELFMALQELGISPEELVAAAQGQGQVQGQELAPKLAADVTKFRRSGKARFEEAKTAAQRRVRDEIKDYIREIAGLR